MESRPVAETSRWMAAARARESEREDRLFHDPLAAALAGSAGFEWLDRLEPVPWPGGPGSYSVIRTRFFDDFLLGTCQRPEVRQVVLLAAGMDTRALRLDWPTGTRLYELDLPEVLRSKAAIMEERGAKPLCERVAVEVDLESDDWPRTLLAAGYEPSRPTVWMIEGLLFYLIQETVHRLLRHVSDLSTTGGKLGLDLMNRDLFLSPTAWPLLGVLARNRTPGLFGTNDPEGLLQRHGWRATVTQPGEEGANFGRHPPPMARWMPGIPRGFLVRASRT